MKRPACGDSGFSIITALFLLVVMAALGAFIVSVSRVQSATLALDVLSSRADQAARAGVEWAAFQVLDPNGTDLSDNPPACPASVTNLTSLAGNLSEFTVRVECTAATPAEKEGNRNIGAYKITSIACNRTVCPSAAPTQNYVERRVQAVLTKCKDPSNAPSKRC
jgi:MSHA biogenesis protein MshP